MDAERCIRFGCSYELFSDANPMMAMFKPMVDWAREHRTPAGADNPFLAWQENLSRQIIAALDGWRDARDAIAEQTFFAIYGSPRLQAAVGIDPAGIQDAAQTGKNPLHQELLRTRIAELKSHIASGGLREAAIRALIYVGIGRAGR